MLKRVQHKRYSEQQVPGFSKKFKKKILHLGRLKNGKRPTSHRSTTYLCYVPILEDFAGAGRVGLAGANIQSFCIFANGIGHINYYCILPL